MQGIREDLARIGFYYDGVIAVSDIDKSEVLVETNIGFFNDDQYK